MSQTFNIQPGGQIAGEIRVPGDKSISHRSIMFGALADGVTEVSGFLDGADCLATLSAFRAMGVEVEGPEAGKLRIHGVGIDGLQAPAVPLDLGNSGTSMRLMSGLLAGQGFTSTLVGDASLSSRPMRRVTDPLAQMGAAIETSEGGTAPLTINGTRALHGIEYDSPVASAQVKSALLLAGLYAEGETVVREPGLSRDHTERMLRSFGYPIQFGDLTAKLTGGGRLTATELQVPADISSAAFFMVAASIAPGSDLLLKDVGLNPTRDGVIQILRLMGADIEVLNARAYGAEPVADLRVQYAPLQGIPIPEPLVPLAIDEFPALFIAAACATGETILTGAEELRVKESDRIAAMATGLQTLGIEAEPRKDGIRIVGGQMGGGEIESHHDHRIAMAFAIAGLRSQNPITIRDCENVDTSFPGFAALAQTSGLQIGS